MKQPSDTIPRVVPTVPMPSADLINFRFDQQDKSIKELKADNKQNFDALSNKLDMLTNTFITKEEARVLKEERDAKFREIDKKFSSYQWYWRAAVVAILSAISMAAAGLIAKIGPIK